MAETVGADDVSPFEMIHSGVIESLLSYLTSSVQLASTSTISDAVSYQSMTGRRRWTAGAMSASIVDLWHYSPKISTDTNRKIVGEFFLPKFLKSQIDAVYCKPFKLRISAGK